MASDGVLISTSDDGLKRLIELGEKLRGLESGLTHRDRFCGKAEESVAHKLGICRGSNGAIRREHGRAEVTVCSITSGAMLGNLLGGRSSSRYARAPHIP